MKAKAATEVVTIPPMRIGKVVLKVVGDSRLVQHNWDEKNKRAIRDKGGKKPSGTYRPKRDPEAEYNAARYVIDGKDCCRAIAFKLAAVRAAKATSLAMVDAMNAFRVCGEFVEIIGKPKMREDMVRVANKNADLRYRPEYWPWSCNLEIQFDEALISAEQIVHLFNRAGFAPGVGEGRPEHQGTWGTFHVAGKGE